MSSFLIRGRFEHRHTERDPWKDGGRDWSEASISQGSRGLPAVTKR